MTVGGIDVGQSATFTRTVTEADTAEALRSGDLPVLATPRLLAWCEAATCRAVEGALESDRTTVGTRVNLAHERPSPIGARVKIRASVVYVDGRLLRFEVVAEDASGTVIGHGEVTRVIVDGERFLSKLT